LIVHLTRWLDPQAESFLRLGYKYISFRSGLAFLLAMALVLWFLPKTIGVFSRKGWINRQRAYMIDSSSKEGVPVMGGIPIFLASMLAIFLLCDLGVFYIQFTIISGLLFFGLGLWDDLLKIREGHHDAGISRGTKYLVQIAVGAALGYCLIAPWGPHPEGLRGTLSIPILKTVIEIGWWQIPFTILAVTFIANAVNFADGMDGLAAGPSLFTFLGIGIFAYLLGHRVWSEHFLFFVTESGKIEGVFSSELVVVCAAMMGALMGFLWYNTYPATIFMGDCGSMYLGGMMAGLCVMTKQEFLFLAIGFFFVLEVFSVFVQDYIGIKLLGRRIFYRAPFHENLKYRGYSEPKIVVRMWILSVAFLAIGLITIKMR